MARAAAGDVVPHDFIRRGEYDWDDPAKLVGSLAAQIEARFPDQHEPEADARVHPAARLDAMLRRVSENELVPRGERLIVLIDASTNTIRLRAHRPAIRPGSCRRYALRHALIHRVEVGE